MLLLNRKGRETTTKTNLYIYMKAANDHKNTVSASRIERTTSMHANNDHKIQNSPQQTSGMKTWSTYHQEPSQLGQSSRWTRYNSLSQSAWKTERQKTGAVTWRHHHFITLYHSLLGKLKDKTGVVTRRHHHFMSKVLDERDITLYHCLLGKRKEKTGAVTRRHHHFMSKVLDERDITLYHSLLGKLKEKTGAVTRRHHHFMSKVLDERDITLYHSLLGKLKEKTGAVTWRHHHFMSIYPALVYHWATAHGRLTWDVLQPKRHRLCMHTETNPMVFISHIIAPRHDRERKNVKPMQPLLDVKPFARWRNS